MPTLSKTTKHQVEKTISVYVWVKRNGTWYYTAELNRNDPDSEYQQIIRAGGKPEEYGIYYK